MKFLLSILLSVFGFSAQAVVFDDSNPLALPPVDGHVCRLIAPNVVEVCRAIVNPTWPLTVFPYVTNEVYTAPTTSDFGVLTNGVPATISSIKFKRQSCYASYRTVDGNDLRILASLYFVLGANIASNATVTVTNNGTHWTNTMTFSATNSGARWSPVLHVNQVGYEPAETKKGYVGFYLGTGGELTCTNLSAFHLVNTAGATVYSGTLTSRLDVGWAITPVPYQQVMEADFTAFTTPGKYLLKVNELGVSYPFQIRAGVWMQAARTSALGFYNQRCGSACVLPYSRHVKNACHAATVSIPTPTASYTNAWATIADNSTPPITSYEGCRYTNVQSGSIDVSGGHHDAGDYSKYGQCMAQMVHSLVFAADSMGDAGDLDNLGIPESGNGRSDLLDEANTEAAALLKMQDTDGGFFCQVNPLVGRYDDYENLTGTSTGLVQIVWPKTTTVTAGAVGALAEIGSSPTFRTQFGTNLANTYLAAATNGWVFLTNALALYGVTNSFQLVFDDLGFEHDDMLVYAASSLFAATGGQYYSNRLMTWWPDANKRGIRGITDPTSTYKWTWQRLVGGYGNAARCYAFAVSSGRRTLSEMDAAYLTSCTNEIWLASEYELAAAESATNRCAYPISLPWNGKSLGGWTPGYEFPLELCFNVATDYQLHPTQAKLDVVIHNLDYLLGNNPANRVYLTGIGQKRRHIAVQLQTRHDAWRKLPVSGHQIGAAAGGTPYLDSTENSYTTNLNAAMFPVYSGTAPFPPYDRDTDTWSVQQEEWITGKSGSKSFAVAAWLAARTSLKTQVWAP